MLHWLVCFHTRERDILKLAFITYIRPLLEFSCQVWALKYNYLIDKIESMQRFFTRRIRGLEKFSYSERLNILGLETFNRRRVIFDFILCYKYLHGFVNTNNCNFIRICQSSRTRARGNTVTEWNCIRNSAVSMRDINFSLTALLTFGTLYLQQSFLAPVWLFLNVI